MPSLSAQRARMMSLRELADRYRALAGEFGKRVSLAEFGLSSAETERLFSSYDEDYHISRFFHFSSEATPQPVAGQPTPGFCVNGVSVTHVALDAEIQTIL